MSFAAVATPHAGAPRLVQLDRLRIAACFGIVWFHLGPDCGRLIGYAGLPVFLLAFFALNVVSLSHAPPVGGFVRRRAQRLLVPWLFWVAMYAGVRVARALTHGHPAGDVLRSLNPLYGTEIHLWYLPFAFMGAAALALAPAAMWRFAGARRVALGFGLSGAALLMGLGLNPIALPDPLGQYCFALPSVLLGAAIGSAHLLGRRDAPGARVCLAVVALLALAACVPLIAAGMRGTWIPYALATPLVCAAIALPGRPDRFTSRLADFNLGIYVMHPLVHVLVGRFIDLSGHLGLRVVLYYALSAAVCVVLRRLGVRAVV
ncbi:Acyltransferase family protein [Phycisphaerae bacterium RAS1]|nr:Acyltransferase family protein [Phycisphaerae bacterium RAS1]